MSKFVNALMNRPTVKTNTPRNPTKDAGIFSGANNSLEGQPVPVAYIVQAPSPLSGPSATSFAARGAWPAILDSLTQKLFNNDWKQSKLLEVRAQNIPGNYGALSSLALFGFGYRAYDGIGNYPNEGFPSPHIPDYNELTPVVWGQRVPNANTSTNTTQQKGSISIQTKPSTWEGSNTASLTRTGVVLL